MSGTGHESGSGAAGRRAGALSSRLAGALTALLVVVVLVAPFILRRTVRYYTDGDGLRAEVGASRPSIREVLWGDAVSAGDSVNTPGDDEYEPRVSPDGRFLVFTRGRPGGGADLWISRRGARGWGTPAPLEAVNSPRDDMGACLALLPGEPPRLALIFYSDREGGHGGYDLWRSFEADDGGWEPPVNLGPEVNGSYNEYSPSVDPDGRTLWFATNRRKGAAHPPRRWLSTIRETLYAPDYDIFTADIVDPKTLSVSGARTVEGLSLPGASEGAIAVAPRGDFVYFSSNRPGGRGGFDLWRARISGDGVAAPENLGPRVNTEGNELDPALAAAGFELYFSRAGPAGDSEDIFVATSSEVFVRTERGDPYWSAITLRDALWRLLRSVDPTILALILSALVCALFALFFGRRMSRLRLLTRCFLLALLVHLLAAVWMNSRRVQRVLLMALRPEEVAEFQVSVDGLAEEDVALAIRETIAVAGDSALATLEPAVRRELPEVEAPREPDSALALLETTAPDVRPPATPPPGREAAPLDPIELSAPSPDLPFPELEPPPAAEPARRDVPVPRSAPPVPERLDLDPPDLVAVAPPDDVQPLDLELSARGARDAIASAPARAVELPEPLGAALPIESPEVPPPALGRDAPALDEPELALRALHAADPPGRALDDVALPDAPRATVDAARARVRPSAGEGLRLAAAAGAEPPAPPSLSSPPPTLRDERPDPTAPPQTVEPPREFLDPISESAAASLAARPVPAASPPLRSGGSAMVLIGSRGDSPPEAEPPRPVPSAPTVAADRGESLGAPPPPPPPELISQTAIPEDAPLVTAALDAGVPSTTEVAAPLLAPRAIAPAPREGMAGREDESPPVLAPIASGPTRAESPREVEIPRGGVVAAERQAVEAVLPESPVLLVRAGDLGDSPRPPWVATLPPAARIAEPGPAPPRAATMPTPERVAGPDPSNPLPAPDAPAPTIAAAIEGSSTVPAESAVAAASRPETEGRPGAPRPPDLAAPDAPRVPLGTEEVRPVLAAATGEADPAPVVAIERGAGAGKVPPRAPPPSAEVGWLAAAGPAALPAPPPEIRTDPTASATRAAPAAVDAGLIPGAPIALPHALDPPVPSTRTDPDPTRLATGSLPAGVPEPPRPEPAAAPRRRAKPSDETRPAEKPPALAATPRALERPPPPEPPPPRLRPASAERPAERAPIRPADRPAAARSDLLAGLAGTGAGGSVDPGSLSPVATTSRFLPRIYSLRGAARREEALRLGGGSEETERAVARGLRWLALHQHPDGRWSLPDYARHVKDPSPRDLRHPGWDGRGQNDSRGGHGYAAQGDTAATGLAILAFLGHGDTHLDPGPYTDSVRRGIDFLVRAQRETGDLRGDGNMYMHGVASFALCEAWALTRDPALEDPCRRAVAWTTKVQNPERGGWRYNPWPQGRDVDTSVFGWMIMALRSARIGGIEVEERVVRGMAKYLDSVRTTKAGGRYAYEPGGGNGTLAIAAQGFFSNQLVRELLPPEDPRGEERFRRADEESIRLLLENRPVWRGQNGDNFYYWYYATLALFQEGGESWQAWNEALKDVLVKNQVGDEHGTAAGSWDPVSEHARTAGRVFSTALATLCLEVYYRYAPKDR